MPGPHKGVFNLAALQASKDIILCEAVIDANDYACKTQPAAKALDLVFHNAVWLGKGGNRATLSEIKDESAAEPANVPQNPEQPPQKSEEPQTPSFLVAEKDHLEPPQPAAAPPVSEPETEIRDEEVIITLDDRRWRVRGLNKNMSYDQLKVNILVSRGQAFFVDTFDLYSARGRAAFLKHASEELRLKEDVIRMDLGKVLMKLEELQDRLLKTILVAKPYARHLTFLDDTTRTRRDNKKYLTLIRSIALLHQFQRPHKTTGVRGISTSTVYGKSAWKRVASSGRKVGMTFYRLGTSYRPYRAHKKPRRSGLSLTGASV